MTIVLDERIALKKDVLSEKGGFPPHYLERSMYEACGEVEIEWVKGYRRLPQSDAGLILVGLHEDIATRMMLIAAAFTRNFIQARVATLHQVLDSLEDKSDEYATCTVLLIPNLYVATHGKVLTGWKVGALHSLLTARFIAGKKTVLYVESFERMMTDYNSQALHDLLWDHYSHVKGVPHV